MPRGKKKTTHPQILVKNLTNHKKNMVFKLQE